MSAKISPLAPKFYPALPAIAGVKLAAMEAGIKYQGRKDLCLIAFDAPAQIAGVFTTSKCPSAPVDWCRENLGSGLARAIVVNSGNANAFTGEKGREATRITADAAAKVLSCKREQVFLASTGVIGEPLDTTGFEKHLSKLVDDLSADGWRDAADAILTTDTYPKLATRSFDIDGQPYTLNGIAKGSGMIAPDMATMLGFLVTDCPISHQALQTMLSAANADSFNAVTVDSDTSTSDTVLLASCGGGTLFQIDDTAKLAPFADALNSLMHELAMHLVRDGEGATKQVGIEVTGAVDDISARVIAKAIANSPLVKTAICGEDANWGRIVMAVGKAGEPADRDKLQISFGDVIVARDGERVPDYSEEAASKVMQQQEIEIAVDLGLGAGRSKVWTCDLTKEYVAINGDYRS